MIKNVKIKASETISWLGGICCVPSACLKNEKTTIKRIKLVITSKSEGASTSKVKTTSTLRELTKSLGVDGAERERLTVGIAVASAPYSTEVSSKNKSAIALISILHFVYQEYFF